MKRFLLLAAMLVAAINPAVTEAGQFIVHEWGTFTSLQNDQGENLPGINIDDEPVPAFVHNLAPLLLNQPILSSEHWSYRQKGAPRQHPMVTMRLETPVIYFYPAQNGFLPKEVDVHVTFRGGWLTEFYPFAKADLPGLKDTGWNFGSLSPETRGSLSWKNVQLNTQGEAPETDEPVWLAPREVDAVGITVQYPATEKTPASEQHERYLFYRGVAHQQAPLRIVTDMAKQELAIHANFQNAVSEKDQTIAAAWLVEILGDGRVAYRRLPALAAATDAKQPMATVKRLFSQTDFSAANFKALQDEMHDGLVSDGLYPKEASAMLATWKRAYFQSPGLRVFYLVPRPWTDHFLPLTISESPQIERVMMGRIELISDAQRELLPKVAKGPFQPQWIEKIPEGDAKNKFMAGRSNFGDLGVTMPDNFQAYLALGRFRNALLIDEVKRSKTNDLKKFVDTYSIRPYDWAK